MKKILSFKDMMKPPPNSALAPYKPVDPEEEHRKKVKQFLDKFKCPLCKCLLEGPITKDFITLRCSWQPAAGNHFKVFIDGSGAEPKILSDTLIFDDKEKRYTINRSFKDDGIENKINFHKIDGNGDIVAILEGIFSAPMVLTGNLFDYQNLDSDKLKNLIKTVLIFG